jgi:4a-hydroxytetrahydrobiopterin dehydratase
VFSESNGALSAEFTFSDFAEAFAFMTQVAAIAEEMGHHPDMAISWNRVSISCSTHDAGGVVTDLDRVLAARIIGLAP